jgi:hypothetical protein
MGSSLWLNIFYNFYGYDFYGHDVLSVKLSNSDLKVFLNASSNVVFSRYLRRNLRVGKAF